VVEPVPLVDPLPEEIDLDELVAFLGHPSRWFVRSRLGMVLTEDEPFPEPREPFGLHGLERYLVRDVIVSTLLDTDDEDDARQAARASGVVPVAEPGRHWLDRAIADECAFVERVRRVRGDAARETLVVDVPLTRARLVGALAIHSGACIFARPAKLKARDRLHAWVRHLAACASPTDSAIERTACVASDRAVAYEPVDRVSAVAHLDAIVGVYHAAHRVPVRFFPTASVAFAWAEHPRSKGRTSPDDAARKEIEDEHYGEMLDPYVRTLFPGGVPVDDPFREVARAVCRPLLDAESRLDA
jgi:exodeoxyribonuclease V gamma subunit